jgi:hypothetical protein
MQMQLSAERGFAVHLEMARLKARMQYVVNPRLRSGTHFIYSQQHQYAPSHTAVPPDPHPVLARDLGLGVSTTTEKPAPSTEPLYPAFLPGVAFTLEAFSDKPRSAVSHDAFKYNPDNIHKSIFISHGDGKYMQGFRVAFILMAGKDRIFYVVFAGEGSGAVSYTARDFFALLVGTNQIFVQYSQRAGEQTSSPVAS